MPLIPALRRQRQVKLCEFKVNLVYRVSSRIARVVTQRNPVYKKKKIKKGIKGQERNLGKSEQCYAHIHEVPPKPTRKPSPVCKSKEPLFYTSLQTWSLRVSNVLE